MTEAKGKDVEYVTIPAEDMHGYRFPIVRINKLVFEPGKTYQVDTLVAGEVKRIVDARTKHDARLMNPRLDTAALSQVEGPMSPTGSRVMYYDPLTGRVIQSSRA